MIPSESNGHPLVAIVTPVYNGGKYLRQAMESVQAQTYPNVVHVVLDNASTDDGADIISEFENRKVPVLRFKNDSVLPLAANWRKAFSHLPADAVYAKLLCADDLMRADSAEHFVKAAESDAGVEIVLSQDVFDDHVHRSKLPQDRTVFDGKTFLRDMMLGKIGWIAHHHFFVRVQPEYRGDAFISDYWSPDPHVVVRSALRGKLAYLHQPLVYNRIHADSVTGKELNKKGVQFELVDMHLLKRFGQQIFGEDQAGKQALNRARQGYIARCARAIMRWSLTGQKERAEELRRTLGENGFAVKRTDYLRSALGWPINSVMWRLHDTPIGGHIDETQFMAMGR